MMIKFSIDSCRHSRRPATTKLLVHVIHSLLVLAVSAGCAVGPDFTSPDASLGNKWIDADNPKLSIEQVNYGAWWKTFDDPLLNRMVAAVYRENLSLQIAALRVVEARAQLAVARGSLFPQQQELSANGTRVGLSKNSPNTSFLDRSFWNYQVGFDAVWELDIWGRFRRGIEAADAGYYASISGYDEVLVSVTAEVARAYTLLRTFEERLALARENVIIQSESLRIADVRFRYGAVSELDVRQARALLRDTEALIPTLEVGIRKAKHAISILIGRAPSELTDIFQVENTRGIPHPPANVAVGAPLDLLRRRPDVNRAERLAAAQSARIGVAKSELYPRFALLGSIGLASSEGGGIASNNANLVDLFKSASLTYMVGPTFSWPILNYGRLRNRVRIQDAQFQQLTIDYKNTVLEAAREVEDALTAFLRAQVRVDLLADSVTEAERSVDLALIQYRAGSVNYQRVLDTQRFLVQQQDRLTETRGDVVLNLVAAYKALGGGWEIRRGRRVLPAKVEKEMRSRTSWGKRLPVTLPDINGTKKD